MGSPKAGGAGSDTFSPETRRAIEAKASRERAEAEVQRLLAPMSSAERVLPNLQWLVCRGDGWMRWTSDRDGKIIYLKFKFNSTAHPNHYVMVSGPVYAIASLVEGLVRKCLSVDQGVLLPTQDRLFERQ